MIGMGWEYNHPIGFSFLDSNMGIQTIEDDDVEFLWMIFLYRQENDNVYFGSERMGDVVVWYHTWHLKDWHSQDETWFC